MKHYLIALLFALGLMSMQTTSASSLIYDDGTTTNLINNTTSGTFKGYHYWGLDLDQASDVTFNLGSALFWFDESSDDILTGTFTLPFASGTTAFNLVRIGQGSYSIATSAITAVPVPAAVWLFGSALAGLIGVPRSKSQPKLAV